MKQILTGLLMLFMALTARANDGVYFVNGNHLVPVQETDISVTKEILTIDICDDGFARVDVYYELTNDGRQKTVDMGFEASLPYNSDDNYDAKGRHPYIFDFAATMNGERLTYKTGVVKASSQQEPTTFKTIDTKRWHVGNQEEWDMGNTSLVDNQGNELPIAYAYFFRATFKPGRNIVHHTYSYQMSYGVYRAFEIPYWLTPATRWANHQIDDFTLRIKATDTAKHFYVPVSVFGSTPFKVVEGTGKVRRVKTQELGTVCEVSLRNGVVEWHRRNFQPKENVVFTSADLLITFDERRDIGSFYDRGRFFPQYKVDFKTFYGRAAKNSAEEKELICRILRNLPYAQRGYVFTDARMKRYFESQWWYMPDASWQMSTADFTPHDWEVINELSSPEAIPE